LLTIQQQGTIGEVKRHFKRVSLIAQVSIKKLAQRHKHNTKTVQIHKSKTLNLQKTIGQEETILKNYWVKNT
jgi:hypothetical protein